MFKTSNITREFNPRRRTRSKRPGIDTWTMVAAYSRAPATGLRIRTFLAVGAGVVTDCLLSRPRRMADRLFAINDAEAHWRGWGITRVHGGFGRRYRDPMFDMLAACGQCQGAGAGIEEMPCITCFGAGRLSLEGGVLAVASGRPRQPNDPSVFSSVEAAISTVPRPGYLGLSWHWRYELAIGAGAPAAVIATYLTLGPIWLIAAIATTIAILTGALIWPASRKWLKARAWCVFTEHRVRTGCANAWVQSRGGRLPVVIRTRPTAFGERVTLWCRAGITTDDLTAARDIIAVACLAREVRANPSPRHPHIVNLDVIRRYPPERNDPQPTAPSWPYLARSDADGLDPEEPATSPSPSQEQETAIPIGG